MASAQNIVTTPRVTLLTILAVFVAVELGAVIRFFILSRGDFPLNDGGLFYVMAQDIANSRFILPVFSSYNGIQMPFVYPPFGFYLAAFLSNMFGLPLITIVRYLPTIFNLLTIPAVYLLAHTILKSRTQAIIAMFAFALLPRSFMWLIMGGGLSRSPGFFFAVLLLQQAYLLYTTHERQYVLSSILLGSLTILSHPEMTLYAGWSCFLFFLVFAGHRRGLIHSSVVIIGILVITAPWWMTVLSRHGFAPFMSAFQTGEQSLMLSLAILLTGVGFVEQSLLGIISLVGGLKRLAEGRYFLPFWLISIFIVAPRSAQTFVVFIAAMLIAIALDELLFPMLRRKISLTASIPDLLPRRSSRIARAVFTFMLLTYSTFTALSVDIPVLAQSERTAMNWVHQNTSPHTRFVLISGYNWYEDAISEWFPVLSNRFSSATVQGFEWFPHQEFQRRQAQHKQLQACAYTGLQCLMQWETDTKSGFTYIYISTARNKYSPLQAELATSSDYTLIYNEGDVIIFQKHPSQGESF